MFLRAMCAALFIFANIRSMIVFLTFCALLYSAVSFVICIVLMFNFIIIFNWINLFAAFASRIHVIINVYFFSYYFLRIILHFLFAVSNAWFRWSSLSFLFFRFWYFEICFWLLFHILLFRISHVIRSLSRRRS